MRRPDLLARVSEGSLLWNYGNVYSQRGQDGILKAILSRLPGQIGRRFVEFGAWDGVYLSNCCWLGEQGWDGTFIEASESKFGALRRNYDGRGASLIHGLVGAPSFGIPGERLSDMLAGHGVASDEVSLVSVDVDGPDLEVFLDAGLKPAIALIEGGFNYTPSISTAARDDARRKHLQHPLGYIVRSLAEHGYTAICFLQDTYAVRNDLAHLFEGVQTDAIALYRDAYNFMDDTHRAHLTSVRRREPAIREFELEKCGTFHVDPTAY